MGGIMWPYKTLDLIILYATVKDITGHSSKEQVTLTGVQVYNTNYKKKKLID